MHHRWEDRLETCLTAMIRTGDGGLLSATIRNLGIGGMYLEIETAQRLRRNAHIVVYADLSGDGRRQSFPGIVTHLEDRGAAVMFSQVDGEMLAALTAVLGENRVRRNIDHLVGSFRQRWSVL